jgi:hypothetical protein
MKFHLGDVRHIHSEIAAKPKFHLCVSVENRLLFLINSHLREGYLEFSNVECPCLKRPRQFLNCALPFSISYEYLAKYPGRVLGRMSVNGMKQVTEHIETSGLLSPKQLALLLPELRARFPK